MHAPYDNHPTGQQPIGIMLSDFRFPARVAEVIRPSKKKAVLEVQA